MQAGFERNRVKPCAAGVVRLHQETRARPVQPDADEARGKGAVYHNEDQRVCNDETQSKK